MAKDHQRRPQPPQRSPRPGRLRRGARRLRRALQSRRLLLRARWRVRRRRPPPPKTAVFAPPVSPARSRAARLLRRVAALAGVAILLVVSLVSRPARQPGAAGAGSLPPTPRIVVAAPATAAAPLPSFGAAQDRPTPPSRPTRAPAPTAPVLPNPVGAGGSVAFTWTRGDSSDIYLLGVGQVEPWPLTADPAPDRQPAWRPDGQALAFASRRDGAWNIYVYELQTAVLRPITRDAAYSGAPAWSPDGAWLAYEAYHDENLDLYLVKADLSEGPYRLTQHPALDMQPAWSPTGRHIAFTSWRGGAPDIYLLALDDLADETAVNLTNSPDLHPSAPAWSPDGRFLAYTLTVAGRDYVATLPLDAATGAVGAPGPLRLPGRDPAWSPDGAGVLTVQAQNGVSYLLASSAAAWGVAAQALAVEGDVTDPSWTARALTPALAARLPLDPPRAAAPLYVEAQARGPRVELFELPVAAPAPYLSDRVDQSFLALRARVLAEAGWDFLGQVDRLFEPLDARPLPGQDGRSWHKAGRAFDLAYRDALALEPRVEVVREEVGETTYWRVYVRALAQDGSQGEPLRAQPWDFRARFGAEPAIIAQGGAPKETIPAGYYVDFTALAAAYGWERVPADANWRVFFPGVRFWQFEKRQGLTWEAAMRELYTPGELREALGE
jgi:TolB protein